MCYSHCRMGYWKYTWDSVISVRPTVNGINRVFKIYTFCLRSTNMQVISAFKKYIPQTVILLFVGTQMQGQPISGVWNGKMGSSRIELKLIRKGDSLIGTSYYYDSKSNYRRYTVKGYFDGQTNDVIWWDDVLIEDNGGRHFSGNGTGALLAVADFNCPGEGIMKLDGKSSRKDDEKKDKKELHLLKGNATPLFPDEWDFLIENYAYGVDHPEVVDSIEQMAYHPVTPTTQDETAVTPAGPIAEETGTVKLAEQKNPFADIPASTEQQTNPRQTTMEVEKSVPSKQEITAPVFIPPSAQSNVERFTSRKKILQQVIPIKGDSIELRFYDNAEIDGDSIAVFLNGRLLKEHILLAEQAYIMKIAVTDLQSDNELVMVAENLGTIPPNTSLMVAVVDDKRYEAHLQSTEGSSALVRLVKP